MLFNLVDDFRTVSTSALEDLPTIIIKSIKISRTMWQVKCTLNYELNSYQDTLKFPKSDSRKLLYEKGYAFHQKTDILNVLFGGIML